MEIDRKDMGIDYDNDEDRISQLPDSVLALILSYLPTIEAVRNCEVSSRWINLCRSPIILVLDAHNMLDADKYNSDINLSQMQCLERGLVKMKRTVEFVYFVCYYLHWVREVQKIEKLKVHFSFGSNGYANQLDQWIAFALMRHVEEIDLCLLEDNYFSALVEGLYAFPCGLLVETWSLKRMRLGHCVLAPPGPLWSIFSGFSTLTNLELMKVDLVSDDHVQNLLWNCHYIESLSLCVCWNLEIIGLAGLNNVETLEYRGRFIWFQFNNTPRLITVLTGVNDWRIRCSDVRPLCRLPIDLPQLETFFLESTCHMAAVMCIPVFRNLLHLVILKLPEHEHDLSWIPAILKAMPRLQKLELHLGKNSDVLVGEELMRDRNWPPRCPHDQLKEVVISGMIGRKSEIEIGIYLLKNATSLKMMEIDPRPRVYLGNGKWNQLEPYEVWTRTGKNKVEHVLKQHAGEAVQLSIL